MGGGPGTSGLEQPGRAGAVGAAGDPAPTSPPRPQPVSSCSSVPSTLRPVSPPQISLLTHVPPTSPVPTFTPTHCPSQPAHGQASCNTASPAFPPPPALSPDLLLDRGPDHPMEWVGCCSLPQGTGVRWAHFRVHLNPSAPLSPAHELLKSWGAGGGKVSQPLP